MSSLAKAFSTGLKTQFNKPSIALAMSTFYQWKNCYNVWQPVSDPVCRCQVWSINSCPAACTHSAGPVRKCRAPRVMLKKRENLQGVWLEKCEDIIRYICICSTKMSEGLFLQIWVQGDSNSEIWWNDSLWGLSSYSFGFACHFVTSRKDMFMGSR